MTSGGPFFYTRGVYNSIPGWPQPAHYALIPTGIKNAGQIVGS